MLTNVTRPLENRRGQVERQRTTQGRFHTVTGTFDVDGIGEGTKEVKFPVTFIEPPSFSFGGEMGPNTALQDSSFPTLSMIVLKWTTDVKNNATYYTGATFVLVTGGSPTQRMTAHWQMLGTALTNPLQTSGSTDDVI